MNIINNTALGLTLHSQPFHSQDLKANSPNSVPYISLLASVENVVLYQDNIP